MKRLMLVIAAMVAACGSEKAEPPKPKLGNHWCQRVVDPSNRGRFEEGQCLPTKKLCEQTLGSDAGHVQCVRHPTVFCFELEKPCLVDAAMCEEVRARLEYEGETKATACWSAISEIPGPPP